MSTPHPPLSWARAAALALFAIMSVAPRLTRAEQLGRLFFTPQYRATLERQRQLNLQQQDVIEGTDLTVNGVVRTSNGRNTVWVNGVPQYDGQSQTGVHVEVDPNNPAKANITSGGSAPIPLRVGDSVNRATGQTQGPLNGGVIDVHRPRPAERARH